MLHAFSISVEHPPGIDRRQVRHAPVPIKPKSVPFRRLPGGGWGYTRSYRDYARSVATTYKANDTIAFWQLVNEAEDPSSSGCNSTIEANGHQHSANLLRRFVNDMGAAVKAADPNHLVSLGTIGGGQCGASGADYKYVHESPGTDMCEYHDYDNAATAMPGDQWNGLAVRVSQCNAIGKPMLIGESGGVADADQYGGSSGSITTTPGRLELDLQPRQRTLRHRPERPGQRRHPGQGAAADDHHAAATAATATTSSARRRDRGRRLRERHDAVLGARVGHDVAGRLDRAAPHWREVAQAHEHGGGWPAARMRTTTGANRRRDCPAPRVSAGQRARQRRRHPLRQRRGMEQPLRHRDHARERLEHRRLHDPGGHEHPAAGGRLPARRATAGSARCTSTPSSGRESAARNPAASSRDCAILTGRSSLMPARPYGDDDLALGCGRLRRGPARRGLRRTGTCGRRRAAGSPASMSLVISPSWAPLARMNRNE